MVKRIFFIAILVIFAVFILQNTQVLEIRFWFWKTQASRALVLLITFVVGLGIGWLAGFWKKTSSANAKAVGSKNTKNNMHSSGNDQTMAP